MSELLKSVAWPEKESFEFFVALANKMNQEGKSFKSDVFNAKYPEVMNRFFAVYLETPDGYFMKFVVKSKENLALFRTLPFRKEVDFDKVTDNIDVLRSLIEQEVEDHVG